MKSTMNIIIASTASATHVEKYNVKKWVIHYCKCILLRNTFTTVYKISTHTIMASSYIIDLVNFSKLKEGLNKYCFRYIIQNSDEWYPFSGFCSYKVLLVLLFLIFDLFKD